LNVGIWANLLFLNKFLSIVLKLVGDKVQIFDYPGKQAEAVTAGADARALCSLAVCK